MIRSSNYFHAVNFVNFTKNYSVHSVYVYETQLMFLLSFYTKKRSLKDFLFHFNRWTTLLFSFCKFVAKKCTKFGFVWDFISFLNILLMWQSRRLAPLILRSSVGFCPSTQKQSGLCIVVAVVVTILFFVFFFFTKVKSFVRFLFIFSSIFFTLHYFMRFVPLIYLDHIKWNHIVIRFSFYVLFRPHQTVCDVFNSVHNFSHTQTKGKRKRTKSKSPTEWDEQCDKYLIGPTRWGIRKRLYRRMVNVTPTAYMWFNKQKTVHRHGSTPEAHFKWINCLGCG